VALHQLWLLGAGLISVGQIARRGVHALLGLIVGIALQVGLLAATSDLAAAWHAVVAFNRGYFESGGETRAVVKAGGWNWTNHLDTLALPIILAGAACLHWLAVWRITKRGHTDNSDHARELTNCPGVVVWLLAWTLIELVLAMLGPHHRLHYLIPVLPPLLLLGGRAVQLLVGEHGLLVGLRRSVATGIALLWMGYMLVQPVRIQLHELGRAVNNLETPWDMQWMVDEVRSRTMPQDGIFVFSYYPRVYWDSGRFSGIKYMGVEKTWQVGQPVVDDIVAELRRRRPKLVVISKSDFDKLDDPGGLDYHGLREWLLAEYTQREVRGYLFLERPAEDSA
jgi:hypothetical protein